MRFAPLPFSSPPAGPEQREEAVMSSAVQSLNEVTRGTVDFYRQAIQLLQEAQVPFLVGGAYAFERYTSIARHTKDLDVFIRPDDCPRFLKSFADAGYYTELTFSHWLAKAYRDDDFIDAIFSSGNALATVDDGWFAHAVESEVFGEPVLLCPA